MKEIVVHNLGGVCYDEDGIEARSMPDMSDWSRRTSRAIVTGYAMLIVWAGIISLLFLAIFGLIQGAVWLWSLIYRPQDPAWAWLVRIGILLEIVAGISLLPEAIGEDWLRKIEDLMRNAPALAKQRHFRGLILVLTFFGCALSMLPYTMFIRDDTSLVLQVVIHMMFLLGFPMSTTLFVAYGSQDKDPKSPFGKALMLFGKVPMLLANCIAWFVRPMPLRRWIAIAALLLFVIGAGLQLAATYYQ